MTGRIGVETHRLKLLGQSTGGQPLRYLGRSFNKLESRYSPERKSPCCGMISQRRI